MKMKTKQDQRMTYQDTVTAAQAIEACAVLSQFLTPILKETRAMGEVDGVVFISGMIADLGALRESLRSMLIEDKVLQ